MPADGSWSDDEEMSEDEDAGDGDDDEDAQRATAAQPAKLSGKDAYDATKVTGKFRTASDVINRLRWDASMDSSDYIIGYEDRFMGARERALDQWKSELTHDEFIPQHRILYFKRRSDGSKVWERSTRIDEIFGSGVRK